MSVASHHSQPFQLNRWLNHEMNSSFNQMSTALSTSNGPLRARSECGQEEISWVITPAARRFVGGELSCVSLSWRILNTFVLIHLQWNMLITHTNYLAGWIAFTLLIYYFTSPMNARAVPCQAKPFVWQTKRSASGEDQSSTNVAGGVAKCCSFNY